MSKEADIVMTPAMIAAGEEAFLNWFRQPHLATELPSLPEARDIHALVAAIISSTTRLRPLS